jgi:6-pyruvoyl-tetrahydropterin synthase
MIGMVRDVSELTDIVSAVTAELDLREHAARNSWTFNAIQEPIAQIIDPIVDSRKPTHEVRSFFRHQSGSLLRHQASPQALA